jgi:hypothetical protein
MVGVLVLLDLLDDDRLVVIRHSGFLGRALCRGRQVRRRLVDLSKARTVF